MVAAVGVTTQNLEGGIAITVSRQEMKKILQDLKQLIIQEVSTLKWQFSDSDFYSNSIQVDLPTVLARRFPYTISMLTNSNGNYVLQGIDGRNVPTPSFNITEQLPLSVNAISFQGEFSSAFDFHSLIINKIGNGPIKITFSSSNF